MIHILGNQIEDCKSKVELLEKDLGNEDDLLTLDCMMVKLDIKYEKIFRKRNYEPENEDDNKK